MKTLIITANPSMDSFTQPIADAYAQGRSQNSEVEIVDLYDKKWAQPFLKYETKKDLSNLSSTTKKFQKKITEADELVFVFPLWHMAEPAILKNFYDNNFTNGFGFEFNNGKISPLLKGKTAKFFVTSSSPKFAWMFLGGGPLPTWKKARMGVCGIKTTGTYVLDQFEKRTEKDRKAFLAKVKAVGMKG